MQCVALTPRCLASPKAGPVTPRGGAVVTRVRSRYAPDAVIRRAMTLAAEAGIKPGGLRLSADGGVEVLDASALTTSPTSQPGEAAEDALEAWKRKNHAARR